MKLECVKKEKYFDIFFVGIEDAAKKSQLIMINDEVIKINDEVMFVRDNANSARKLMYATLFIGTYMVEVDEKSFKAMEQVVLNKEKDKDYILVDYGRKPNAKVLINLRAIKNNMVTLKVNEDTIIVNNIIFTVNAMEFLGDSLFAGKQNSFKVAPDVYTYIKKYLTIDTTDVVEQNEQK